MKKITYLKQKSVNSKLPQDYYDALKTFQEIANKYPLLNKVEERALIDKFKENRPVLNSLLFKHNIRLVMNLARKYVNRSNSPADLLMNGAKGLMIATEKFDVDKNIKFNTYATSWIFKYIVSEFYSRSPIVGVNAISLNNMLKMSGDNNGKEFIDILVNDQNDYDNSRSASMYYNRSTNDPGPKENYIENENRVIVDDIIKMIQEKSDFLDIDNDIIYNNLLSKNLSISEISSKNNSTVAFTNKRRRHILNEFKNILSYKYNINKFSEFV